MFCGFFGDGMGLFSGFAVDVRVEVGFVLGWRLGLCVVVNRWSKSDSVAFFFFV